MMPGARPAPFDPLAGQIPGARHYFWKDALEAAGSWKSPEQLRERFAAADDDNTEFSSTAAPGSPPRPMCWR